MIVKKWKDRKYYKGWSKGSDIYLYYKEDGNHKREVIRNFPFYFLVKEDDFLNNKDIFRKLKDRKYVSGYKRHDEGGIDRWVRVYVRKNHKRNDQFNTYLESGEWNKLENIANLVKAIEDNGIRTYEADLTPLHRFLADYDINFDDDIRILYFDLETDDTQGGFSDESMARNRVLSFSVYGSDGRKGVVASKSNAEEGERILLKKFYKIASQYDVISAWNGANFDFKVLRFRMAALGIKRWNDFEHEILHADLLQSCKRNASSGEFQSFSLDNIGNELLGMKKIDLGGKRIHELYEEDIEKLKEYNFRDVELMYKIEKEKGYLASDMRTSILGNRFTNYFNSSPKVEGCILREGNIRGYHYPTVLGDEGKCSYQGGYVVSPDPGIYENVATLDFKSLYPSIIQTFNISHDTVINSEDGVDNKEDIITTPVSGTVKCFFIKNRIGIIPYLLENLYKKREEFERLRNDVEYGSDQDNYYRDAIVALKTMFLSFYGEFGNYRSRFFDLRLARTVTLSGQFYNKLTIKCLKKLGYETIYGDTDSVFPSIELDDIPKFLNKVHKYYDSLADKLNANKGGIILEFENYYKSIIFLAKKRYVGVMKLYKGREADDKIYVRGLETRRSNVPVLAKRFQNECFNNILIEKYDLDSIKKFVLKYRKLIDTGEIDVDSIVCHQSVQKELSEYGGDVTDSKTGKSKIKKDGSIQIKPIPLHVKIAKKLVRNGKEFYVGMQIPYIVTDSSSPMKGIHIDEFKGKFDKKYYWNNLIYDPCKRILEAIWKDYDWDRFYINEK